ncbi:hypothetical protein BD310DRAFT_124069 [Dichomitus squalens]|uniref:Secreted protein n=1 Tax=Dichomitus squalens TaxID=114155 RepID=A0A4Q9Q4A7_9APHY|nr:hypothetical protein BD310DRAFT_124069 [Dichomitus squalens]
MSTNHAWFTCLSLCIRTACALMAPCNTIRGPPLPPVGGNPARLQDCPLTRLRAAPPLTLSTERGASVSVRHAAHGLRAMFLTFFPNIRPVASPSPLPIRYVNTAGTDLRTTPENLALPPGETMASSKNTAPSSLMGSAFTLSSIYSFCEGVSPCAVNACT